MLLKYKLNRNTEKFTILFQSPDIVAVDHIVFSSDIGGIVKINYPEILSVDGKLAIFLATGDRREDCRT